MRVATRHFVLVNRLEAAHAPQGAVEAHKALPGLGDLLGDKQVRDGKERQDEVEDIAPQSEQWVGDLVRNRVAERELLDLVHGGRGLELVDAGHGGGLDSDEELKVR